MNDSALTLSIINSAVIVIATLFGKNYLTSYFTEKGKNLASKEDIHEITDKVEKIKSQYLLDIERVKSSLQAESAFLQKRRLNIRRYCWCASDIHFRQSRWAEGER